MGTGIAIRIVDKEQASVGRGLSAAFAGSLARDGQSLLPIAELIASGRAMVDQIIDVMGPGRWPQWQSDSAVPSRSALRH